MPVTSSGWPKRFIEFLKRLTYRASTPIFLILGEIVPKAIFQEKADTVAPIVARPLRWLAVILAPAVLLFSVVGHGNDRIGPFGFSEHPPDEWKVDLGDVAGDHQVELE